MHGHTNVVYTHVFSSFKVPTRLKISFTRLHHPVKFTSHPLTMSSKYICILHDAHCPSNKSISLWGVHPSELQTVYLVTLICGML